jgi:hypothetical protein
MFNQALLQEPMFTVATPVLSLSENKPAHTTMVKFKLKNGVEEFKSLCADKLGPVELLGNVSLEKWERKVLVGATAGYHSYTQPQLEVILYF